MSPRVSVIGAGPSGITACKNLLAEGIQEVHVFEKNDQVGGNWVLSDKVGHSPVYETPHIISSKSLTQYADFPMPDAYLDYPSHTQLKALFQSYAEHFDVLEHIRFRSEVLEAVSLEMGGWRLRWRDSSGDHRGDYDFLIVCNGHHWDPFTPDYPGQFDGTIIHSHAFKRGDTYREKRF